MLDQTDDAANQGQYQTSGQDGFDLDAVLDPKVLAQIRALDESFLAELSALYIEDASSLLATLDQALVREDGEALRQAAHRFKSGSYNIGAQCVAALCQQLELLGRAGKLSSAARLLEQLKVEYRQVCNALANMCPQQASHAAA